MSGIFQARPRATEKASRVTLLLLDVDGVLTDGGIVYDGDGREIKRFDVRDGHGIKMLQRAGVRVGILSGRTSPVVDVRARDLGIDLVRQGATDKGVVFAEILATEGVAAEEVGFIGDDIIDLPVIRKVAFSAAPADAEESVAEVVDVVTSRRGGHGAVREVIEFILRAKGSWETVTARYFREEG